MWLSRQSVVYLGWQKWHVAIESSSHHEFCPVASFIPNETSFFQSDISEVAIVGCWGDSRFSACWRTGVGSRGIVVKAQWPLEIISVFLAWERNCWFLAMFPFLDGNLTTRTESVKAFFTWPRSIYGARIENLFKFVPFQSISLPQSQLWTICDFYQCTCGQVVGCLNRVSSL